MDPEILMFTAGFFAAFLFGPWVVLAYVVCLAAFCFIRSWFGSSDDVY